MSTDITLYGIIKSGFCIEAVNRAVGVGLIFGVVAVYVAAVGLLSLLEARAIIVDALTMAQAALILLAFAAGFRTAWHTDATARWAIIAQSVISGAVAGGVLAAFAAAIALFDLRQIFITMSPSLAAFLTFGLPVTQGVLVLVLCGAALGAAGSLVRLAPQVPMRAILTGFGAVLVCGSFQELIQIFLPHDTLADVVRRTFFHWNGLTLQGAVIVFGLALCGALAWNPLSSRFGLCRWRPRHGPGQVIYNVTVIMLLLVLFTVLGGSYVGQVMLLVALYSLMGMGLNLELGLAGLLDLGFVAFFAVGAYVTALLTANSPHALSAFTAIPSLSFWVAMPIAVMASVTVGVLFGLPVLGVRGDYLAVATMGLGEIVRVIVQSDAAAPLLAGGEGILQIPRPWIGNYELADPVALFLLTLIFTALAAYIAYRLERSRLGRAWMALRDDEDVAQALGVNLVQAKLLAYGMGAAFAGLAGATFAAMIGSVYPSSFQLLVSINILALIVIGGMGSLPGVILGAAVLVGLPELLREFAEYRYLVYGAALVFMMRVRPEGLWPSVARRREHVDAAG